MIKQEIELHLEDEIYTLVKNGTPCVCPYQLQVPIGKVNKITGQPDPTSMIVLKQFCNSQCAHFSLSRFNDSMKIENGFHPDDKIVLAYLSCGTGRRIILDESHIIIKSKFGNDE